MVDDLLLLPPETRPAREAQRPQPVTGPLAVINLSAAGVTSARRKALRHALHAHLGLRGQDIIETEGAGLVAALRDAGARRPQTVLIVGGDGSARTALETLTPLGVATAPLPGGTLNRLSIALYGRRPLAGLLQRVGEARPLWIPGGQVAGRRFFVASGYGPLMRLNAVRESLRAGEPLGAWRRWRALAPRLFEEPLLVGPEQRPAACVLIGVGPLDAAFGLKPPIRPQGFEAASAQWRNLGQALQIAPAALMGGWRSAPGVQTVSTQAVRLAQAEGSISALLDGEPVELPNACVIEYHAANGLVLSAEDPWTLPRP